MKGAAFSIACLFILTPAFSFTLPTHAQSLPHVQPYIIHLPEEESETTRVLFVTSLPTETEHQEFYRTKIELLKDVIYSHWRVEVTEIDMNRYTSGTVQRYDNIFLIQEAWTAPPQALLVDLAQARNKKVLLTGYAAPVITHLLGQYFSPATIPLSWLAYKEVIFSEEAFTLLADTTPLSTGTEGLVEILSEAGTEELGKVWPTAFLFTNVSHVGNTASSTFLALPFPVPSYYAIENHSIVFLDLLHEVLGDHGSEGRKTALLRLEDINVFTYFNPSGLRDVYSFLKKNEVPFHVALIARYINPARDIEMELDEGRRFFHLLTQMVGEGWGTLVQHGYTHQDRESISGVGFEFWDESTNAPLLHESEAFVEERIELARQLIREHGLPVSDIWETPHYAASPLANGVLNRIYPLRYERPAGVGALPFPINTQGSIFIPENLGFITDTSTDFQFGQDISDIQYQLDRLEVFRDPVASVFWHPWRDISEVKEIVRLLRSRGYEFVSLYDLVDEKEGITSPALVALASYRDSYGFQTYYHLENILLAGVYLFFVAGCVYYMYTIVRLRKYMKTIGVFEIPLRTLRRLFMKRGVAFPFFIIFVPARNEGYVIENTVRRLAALDYPKAFYKIVVIVDERELDDDVEVLTRDVVERVGAEINAIVKAPLVSYVEVPKWYSGVFGDTTQVFGKSTKGRALNYALQHIKHTDVWKNSDMVGVLDADGRLHPNVLKEAAYKRVVHKSRLLQGPVFQVSNFSKVSLTGIAAAIELAIHHLTDLPATLLKGKRIQFLAGTNYFVDKDIMADVGGWNQHALVEDAELALRIYVEKNIVAGWLSLPEIEQTPKSFAVYRKQRQRWVRGHLDLMRIIIDAPISRRDKTSFFLKIIISQFRFMFDLGLPVVALVLLFSGAFLDLGPLVGALSLILVIFAALMWDLYGSLFRRLSNYIDPEMKTRHKILQSVKLFLFSPVFMVIQSIPRIQGLAGYVFSSQVTWYKTERTKEIPTV